jgi:hypothetical protein
LLVQPRDAASYTDDEIENGGAAIFPSEGFYETAFGQQACSRAGPAMGLPSTDLPGLADSQIADCSLDLTHAPAYLPPQIPLAPVYPMLGQQAVDAGSRTDVPEAPSLIGDERTNNVILQVPGQEKNRDEESEVAKLQRRRARQVPRRDERKYRDRLNAQFGRLMAVLPTDKCRDDKFGLGGETRDLSGKRFSKAEALDMAHWYIKMLEAEKSASEALRRQLETEKRYLELEKSRLDGLGREVADRGGAPPSSWFGQGVM